MTNKFNMSMFGELKFFLGLQVTQSEDGIFVTQSKYAEEMMKKFGITGSKVKRTPMSTSTKLTTEGEGGPVDQSLYRSMIGSLLYLTASRPDIAYSVGVCSRFQSNPKESHLTAVKNILRYVKGTSKIGLWYAKGSSMELIGYSDADWAGNPNDRKSTTGGCFYLGENLISWHTKKQNCVALSSTEAEYIAAGSACTQLIWMTKMLNDYGVKSTKFKLYCDNKGAIDLSKNPVSHSKAKHIAIRHHFIRDLVEDGSLAMEHISTTTQLSDIFTKPLDNTRFEYLRGALGMCTH